MRASVAWAKQHNLLPKHIAFLRICEGYLYSEYHSDLPYFLETFHITPELIIQAVEDEQDPTKFVDDVWRTEYERIEKWYVASLMIKPFSNYYGFDEESALGYDTEDPYGYGHRYEEI